MTKADLYFAIIPDWLIDVVSPRALQVYAILRRHADYTQADAETFVSRRRMAKRGDCSVATIDRALRELETIGAIDVVTRFEDGRQTTNLYTVRTIRGPLLISEEGVGRVYDDGPLIMDDEPVPRATDTESQETELALRASEPTRKQVHDAMAWALVDGLGWDRDEVPEPQWGRIHAAASTLTDIGADPDEVPRRIAVYRVKYSGAAVTPTAIAANWAALAHVDDVVTDRQVERAATRAATRAAVAQLGGDNNG